MQSLSSKREHARQVYALHESWTTPLHHFSCFCLLCMYICMYVCMYVNYSHVIQSKINALLPLLPSHSLFELHHFLFLLYSTDVIDPLFLFLFFRNSFSKFVQASSFPIEIHLWSVWKFLKFLKFVFV